VQGSTRHAAFFRLLVGFSSCFTALAMPASAFALAGGSTGGGGGGGGGFSSSGGSSSSYGGGYGGSGGDCDASECVWAFGIVFGIFLIVPLIAIAGAIATKARRRAREMRVEAAFRQADAGDAYWDPAKLKQRITQCFFPIQLSWEKRDIEMSRPYVSDSLYERHKLQLKGYEEQNRVNRIADLKLHDIRLARIHNVTEDGEDRFVAHIKCSARDWMEDTRTGAVVNGNKMSPTTFEQYWSFARHPQYGWVLDEIQQAEEGKYHEAAPIINKDEGPLAEPVIDDGPDAAADPAVATAPAPTARAWDGSDGAQTPSNGGATHPANWYPDPQGAHKWRWWDGTRWTTNTAD
jgi:hypothetical protein